MPKARVISFINMKGGVGKTTCAVHVATYLARDHGKRVLPVDFDPQTNASLSVMSDQAWHFFDTYIPENIKLVEAPMEARPIALHDASASGAAAFQALAGEFLARLEA